MAMKDQLFGSDCPSCGQPNSPAANYCQYCGTQLVAEHRADLTLSIAGLRCPTCAMQNLPGVTVCESCGTNLLTGEPAKPQEETGVSPEEPDTKNVAEYQRKITRRGKSTFEANAFLNLQIAGSKHPLTLRIHPKHPLMFGRSLPAVDQFVIDLTPYGGHDTGVSRRHAALERDGNALFLWDLNSSNGTYLNGIRLTPLQLHQVHDGDEICLGRLIIYVHFQTPESDK